jgi:hypothetical protein
MIRRLSLFVIVAQWAISSMVRPQPMHNPDSRSMSQMLTQGVSIERFALPCDAPMELGTQFWGICSVRLTPKQRAARIAQLRLVE